LGISKACEYAILILEYFSTIPKDKICSKSEIVKKLTLPEDYISKVLQNIVKAGIISSVKGVKGGYKLNRPAAEITYLDIIEAIDGKIKLVETKQGVLNDSERKILHETIKSKMLLAENGISKILKSIKI